MDDTLTISKEELIEILTYSNRYNQEGIEIVLDRDSLKGVLEAIMCDIESLELKVEHYENQYNAIRQLLVPHDEDERGI